MPVYVTGAEVYDLLMNLKVGGPARITVDDVEPFIDGVEQQVNGVLLARGYQPIPASHAGAVAVIREMVRKKTAVQVYLTLNQPQKSPDWAKSWDIDFDTWLDRLSRGRATLPGGTVNPTGDVTVGSLNLGLTEVEDS